MPTFTLQGTTAPGFTPSYLGQQYVNTALGVVYFAVGTASSADWKSAGGGVGDALTSGNLSQFAATTSAQFLGIISDKTGTGLVVGNNGPTFIAPILGTPASGNLSNCTALPLASVTGLGTGVATFLATPSSANLAAALADETGGNALVFADNPTLTRAQIAMGSLSADTQGINLTATYNNAGVTFGGVIKANVTDTASNAASLLMDLQVGGSSKLKVRKDGAIMDQYGGYFKFGGSSYGQLDAEGGYRIGNGSFGLFDGSGIALPSTSYFAFSSTTNATSTLDLKLYRDASNTLALRNSTNAQTLRVYGTYATAGADYVRGSLSGSTTAFTIAAESGGTGSANLDIVLTPKGTGGIKFGTDNTYDIGTSSSGRPRFIYSGSAIIAGSAYYLGLNARLGISSPSDGVALIQNWAGTSFDRLQYGGTTNSFPCHKRRGATLECRLADDSAIATFVGAMVRKAGAVSDADFTNPVDGCHGFDTTNKKHYIREGGVWYSSAAYT